jgi:hypothetical protein
MWHDFEMSSEGCGADHALGEGMTGKKTTFLRHLYINAIILPRQARDKHRENSKKDRFLAAYRLAATFLKEGGRRACRVVCGGGGGGGGGSEGNHTCEGLAPVRWHLHYNSLPPVQSGSDCPGSYL